MVRTSPLAYPDHTIFADVNAKGVNRMNSRINEPKDKKVYSKPSVVSEQMFETAALACGKCTSGPFPQFACGSLPQTS